MIFANVVKNKALWANKCYSSIYYHVWRIEILENKESDSFKICPFHPTYTVTNIVTEFIFEIRQDYRKFTSISLFF